MKINLLYMIIFATAFSCLQIHTMENQQLVLQAQHYTLQSTHQSASNTDETKKLAIAKALININNPNPVAKNNSNVTPIEEQYTAISLEPLDDIDTSTQHNQNTNQKNLLTTTRQNNTPIMTDPFIQKKSKNECISDECLGAMDCGVRIFAGLFSVACIAITTWGMINLSNLAH